MTVIVTYESVHLERIVALSLRAWAPVFDSIASTLGEELFCDQYPDWRAQQGAAVEAACREPSHTVFVAQYEAAIAGFAVLRLHSADRIGEIHMIAVDPLFQRRGIGAALTRHALEWLRATGMTSAMVETGGDPGHAPARHTYEAAGFRAFPVVKYFKKI